PRRGLSFLDRSAPGQHALIPGAGKGTARRLVVGSDRALVEAAAFGLHPHADEMVSGPREFKRPARLSPIAQLPGRFVDVVGFAPRPGSRSGRSAIAPQATELVGPPRDLR